MPYKYIGPTSELVGKTLWEILGNLKNLGIGRLVTRTQYEKYPEPCYLRILKVESQPSPADPSQYNVRWVKVHAEQVFRGKRQPEELVIDWASSQPDFKLIPKHEEANYTNREVRPRPEKIFPKATDFPPLLKKMIAREMQARGEDATKVPQMDLVFNKSFQHRIAKDGETPNVQVTVGLGKPASPGLYKNLKL